jgi:hypothetical protein
MLVRTSLLDRGTLALMPDASALHLGVEGAELRCGARGGTVALGFRTRCAHCRRVQRLPKPVLRGWTCAACVAGDLSPR